MDYLLELQIIINKNISNEQLILMAGYGFCCGIYHTFKLLSKLKANDFIPRDHYYGSDSSESESSEIINSESSLDPEPESSLDPEPESSDSESDKNDSNYVQPSDYKINLRKRRRFTN